MLIYTFSLFLPSMQAGGRLGVGLPRGRNVSGLKTELFPEISVVAKNLKILRVGLWEEQNDLEDSGRRERSFSQMQEKRCPPGLGKRPEASGSPEQWEGRTTPGKNGQRL